MKLGKQTLNVNLIIRRNWLETEMRVEINQKKVEQYAEEISNGAKFPVPVVFFGPDEIFRVGDGFHRILAQRMRRQHLVEIDVRAGGFREAFLFNIVANRDQRGLPHSFGDKKRCLWTLLEDDVTRKWTLTKMAETVGCEVPYASQVCSQFKAAGGERPATVIDCNGVIKSQPASKCPATVEERRQKALEMHLEGVPKIEIARRLGVARYVVQRYIDEGANAKDMVSCQHCKGTGFVKMKSR